MASELVDRPFLAYLAGLSADIMEQLYQSEACCLAIFRLLPPVSQQCVAMMVFSKDFDITKQCNPEQINVVVDNVTLLQKLHLLVEDDRTGIVSLQSFFRYNYMTTTQKSAVETSGIGIRELDTKTRKAASKDLYQKAVERWECILTYLALPSDSAVKNVSTNTRELFQHIGFTRQTTREMEITSLGFQFLLLSRNEQIWTYLIYYLKYLEATSPGHVVVLLEFFFSTFLFQFKSATVADRLNADESSNRNITTPFVIDDNWNDTINSFLVHLRELGLVFIRKRKDGFFFITPLLISLVATDSIREGLIEVGRDKGFLVTETNYRLYAYTNSELHLSVLATFTEPHCRFPNFVVVHMTRESVRRALQAGITARQITQYLRSNSHWKSIEAHGALHCVPPTVVDQVHLWEEERERLVCQDCVMYSTFESEEEYVEMRNFCTENQILFVRNPNSTCDRCNGRWT
ncbi:General transcription factor IIH subunit 4 [Aphelenchoides besseyi]|nr:General transcription factor IIH subunit 4 [Aphelenchoides besseyi]